MSKMTPNIEENLKLVLEESAKLLNKEKYIKHVSVTPIPHTGFLSDIHELTLTHPKTSHVVKLVVKKTPKPTPQRPEYLLTNCFLNESYFYKHLIKKYRRLERRANLKETFQAVPTLIHSKRIGGEHYIVMNDLRDEGYVLMDQVKLFDEEHITKVLQAYGQLHAMSFCLKAGYIDCYEDAVDAITPIWMKALDRNDNFGDMFQEQAGRAIRSLDLGQHFPIIKKLQKYIVTLERIFRQLLRYKGQYACLLHGNGWSNNMMFKYKMSGTKKKLESVKIFDFQQLSVGSTVFDLSSFLYICGSKDVFAKLEHFLDVYYESFSSTCQKLGHNAAKLFPRAELSKEWQMYSKLGLILSFLFVKVKLMRQEDIMRCINGENVDQNLLYNHNIFNKRMRDILVHMDKIDAM